MSTNKSIAFNDILNNSQLILEKEQQRQHQHVQKSSTGAHIPTQTVSNPLTLTNNTMINTGIPNLHQVNMQVHMENQYMNNIMLGHMNASDLEYNMMYFNNHHHLNQGLGNNTNRDDDKETSRENNNVNNN
jgi:hypothetical protein